MGTATSDFGVSQRVGHDSSKFYRSKKYDNHVITNGTNGKTKSDYKENKIKPKNINKIFHKSSELMSELPDNSVHLMITSPPYNVGKEYDDDLTVQEYRTMLCNVWQEVYRVLVAGGRVCINIANIGRKPYIPLNNFIVADMLESGFLMRGEIIWNKGASAGTSCAWGSWCSPSNPVLRDTHEYIMVFCKESFGRAKPKQKNKKSTISKEQFLEYTRSVWEFPAASARKIGHAAPFPLELPSRFIQLFSYTDDVVLDPFVGSGTTALAAKQLQRSFVGYDTEKKYVQLSNERLTQPVQQKVQWP